ncbi:MAG: RluA family pseudouridine synthase [Sphaerochaetaceae bacterium]|nr:RluA family pseudouridine synthase [Sphaerochaetaceae bacterium]
MAVREHAESFCIDDSFDSCRIDMVCSSLAPDFSRTLSDDPETRFFLNGRKVKKSKRVKKGDEITLQWTEHFFDSLEPQDIPLKVLYEDDSILVIDKEAGMVVHPGSGNWDRTVANALVYRYGDSFVAEHDQEKLRPGIVHRLDKDTSGVLLIAKTAKALREMNRQFKDRQTDKYYIAVAEGVFETRRGSIRTSIVRDERDRQKFSASEDPDKGKKARTDYLVLKQYEEVALIRVHLFTGRTHQIRVHLQSIFHPIVGDSIYNRKKDDSPLLLHALSLSFDHPETKERMKITSPMPQRFKDKLLN